MTKPVRVLVAEDQQLVLSGIISILESGGCDVVASATNGERAIYEARRTTPDVALIDIRMPVLDGIQTTRRITSELSDTKVLVLTTFGTEENVFEALSAGASGFLLKDTRPEQLVEAVLAVARGEGRLDPAVTSAVVQHFRSHIADGKWQGIDRLTAREREVLLLLARGMSNGEIAETIFVSPGTVKTHVATILGKLGVRDRIQAVIAAYESGLVRP